jgi:undecaprenyl-diphosphatase
MPLVEVIVLGIVQGLTEFLPISSTAHLAVVPWLFGWPDPGLSYDIALHVGTLAAVLLYFFRDWVQIIGQAFGISGEADPVLRRNHGLLWLLIAGTIPAGLAGFAFQKQAETTLRTPYVIGAMMIGIGLVLWLAERAGRRQKDLSHVSFADSLAVGVAQALAVIPGVSRSGVTIAAGLFRNLDRASAARFSFLLSTPVIAGAAAKDLWDLTRHEGGVPPEMRGAFLIGIMVSALAGGLTIKFFLEYLKRRGLTCFVLYRLIFGIMIIALAHFFRYSGG